MAEPTLQSIFGSGATQTATTLTILKADLPTLTASSTNTAESLLVGVILTAEAQENKANFDSNIDQSIYFEEGYPGYLFRGTDNTRYKNNTLTVNLAKLDTSTGIDADDY